MGPTAAPKARGPLPFLLLLLAGPAAGNEGGAAGSCQCKRVASRPRFLDRLESCDTCKDWTRFKFPNRTLCGLQEQDWVVELKNSRCPKGGPGEEAGRRRDAARGHHFPAPATSPTTGPPPPSPSSSRASLGWSRAVPQAAEPQEEVAWVPATAGSPPEPNVETAARGAKEEKMAAPDARTPGVTTLCVAVVVGLVVLAFCWRRRQRRQSQAGWRPPTPLGGGQDEGTVCLPGENT